MNKNIQKQLKTEYEKLEINPSIDLWSQIEDGLDSSVETSGNRPFIWRKYAAVVIFLVSISSLFYLNSNQSSTATKTVVSHSEKQSEIPFEKNSTHNVVVVSPEKMVLVSELKENKVSKNKVSNRELKEINKDSEIDLDLKQKEIKIEQIAPVYAQTNEVSAVKTLAPEHKKVSYISANELLLGREFDKTREEARSNKQFGVLDVSKIKIRRPHLLNILGVTVYSDSTASK